MPASVLNRYVGRYQFAPQVFLMVVRKGDELYAQPTGQGYTEIFPKNATDFFYTTSDFRLSFVVGAGDLVTGLVIHHNGRDQPATRISSSNPTPDPPHWTRPIIRPQPTSDDD